MAGSGEERHQISQHKPLMKRQIEYHTFWMEETLTAVSLASWDQEMEGEVR